MNQGEKYTSKLGYYPCIYMTLKDVKGTNYKNMLLAFKTEIVDIFIDHVKLLQSTKLLEIEKEMFNKILNIKANEVELQNSLKLLSKLLYKEYEKPVILLIDEYDVPLQNAYVEKYYKEAKEFFKNFYGATFKDNNYLEKTIITGVSRVAKESIFTGANNFDVYTVLQDNEFSEDFGITEKEIEKIIQNFKIQEDKEKIKKWYDGYTVGKTTGIYNPWSILNYLKNRELIPYWVNTSSNDLIKLILKNSTTVKEKIERLLKGEEVEVKIDLETIIAGIEQKEDNIWGMLLGTGYLKAVEVVDLQKKLYKVKIVNYEVRSLFENIIDDWFRDKVKGNDLNLIIKDLITLNI